MRYPVIFLDIDGVLNSHQFLAQNAHLKWEDQVFIDETKMNILKDIVAKTDARIVLSSSWRRDFDDQIKPLSDAASLMLEIFSRFDLQIWDKTEDDIDKADSINRWLDANKKAVQNYVVLDDDYLDVTASNFIKTSFYRGLTDEIADKAINILNG